MKKIKKYIVLFIILFNKLLATNDFDFYQEILSEVENNNIAQVKQLIQKTYIKDIQNYLDTALYIATERDFKAMAKLLLSYNANVNIEDDLGYTPLMLSCDNDNSDLVKLLLKNGADLNIKSKNGHTALEWADGHKYIENILRSISQVELNIDSFKDQSNKIKKLLIARWINTYKKDKDQKALERLIGVKKLVSTAQSPKSILSINQEIKIRNFLADINKKIPKNFCDVLVKTIS